MKYRLTGLNPKETIKKYKIDKNGIKIKYLKGSKVILNTDENLNEIIEMMEEQANIFIDNNKNIVLNSLKDYLAFKIVQLIFLLGEYNLLKKNTFSGILLFLALLTDIISKIYILKNFNLYFDLEKYKLFLENKKDLELQSLFPYDLITINNLDKTSLKKLKERLLLIEQYKNVNKKLKKH